MLLSALTLPLARRSGSTLGPKARIGRLFGLALVMTIAVVVTWQGLAEAINALRGGDHASVGAPASGHGLWGLPVIVISVSTLALVIAGTEALLHMVGAKPTLAPPPISFALPTERAGSGIDVRDR